jgi:hypothetical protein
VRAIEAAKRGPGGSPIARLIALTMCVGVLAGGGCATSYSELASTGPLDFGMADGGGALYGMCHSGDGTSNSLGGLRGWNSSSKDALVLDSVAVGGGVGVEVAESYIVPLAGVDSESFGSGFTLPSEQAPGAEDALSEEQLELWQKRIPLEGAQIGPGEAFNLLVGVVPTVDRGATSEWLEVRYHVGGRRHISYPGIGAEFLGPDECA